MKYNTKCPFSKIPINHRKSSRYGLFLQPRNISLLGAIPTVGYGIPVELIILGGLDALRRTDNVIIYWIWVTQGTPVNFVPDCLLDVVIADVNNGADRNVGGLENDPKRNLIYVYGI